MGNARGAGGDANRGVRSFAIVGLLGGIWGALSIEAGEVALGLSFTAFASLLIAAHVMRLRSNPGERSVTTVLAALLTFGLGALAARGHLEAAAAGGVVALALLALKQPLHRFVARIDPVELKAAVQLLLISVVLLPVLPDRGLGPDQAINPFSVWLVVVLITAIGFVGYVAIQLAGVRIGAMMTGVFGGLASSTALSLTFARYSRKTPELGTLLAAGVSVANSIMALRILVIAAVLSPALLAALALPMGAMAAVGLAGAWVLWYLARNIGMSAPTPVANPFELWTAIKFALFLAAVVLFSVLMRRWFGDAGVYAVAAVSGVADVDAITVSMSSNDRRSDDDAGICRGGRLHSRHRQHLDQGGHHCRRRRSCDRTAGGGGGGGDVGRDLDSSRDIDGSWRRGNRGAGRDVVFIRAGRAAHAGHR